MTFELLLKFSILLFGLIIAGSVLCLPLYSWNVRKLIASSLFTKIIWWGPIFLVLIAVLYGQTALACLTVAAVILLAVKEFINNNGYKSRIATLYLAVFSVLIAHLAIWFLAIPTPLSVKTLAAVCVASVLSDIFAFFFGNYLSKHPLPAWINNRKSWEGVIGQLVGAFIGASLAAVILGITLPVLLVVLIGIASAFGDLFNSITKRNVDIKDWGNTIPGHGGVLDRLSSLSYALVVSFWYIVTFLV
jgi:phosphatidate cytidylyltransferase